MFVALLALFLFFWACLRFKNNILSRELDEMRAINALLEQRQDELAQLAENNSSDSAAGKARDSGLVSSSAGSTLCVLKGQNRSPAFEVPSSSIVYVESIANYADICYMEDDKMLHKTLRITLKREYLFPEAIPPLSKKLCKTVFPEAADLPSYSFGTLFAVFFLYLYNNTWCFLLF